MLWYRYHQRIVALRGSRVRGSNFPAIINGVCMGGNAPSHHYRARSNA